SYRVQVGRFTDERDADNLRDELTQAGLSPRVVKTQKGGVTTYRVQVGTYRQKENADRQIEMLKSRAYDPYLAEEEPGDARPPRPRLDRLRPGVRSPQTAARGTSITSKRLSRLGWC